MQKISIVLNFVLLIGVLAGCAICAQITAITPQQGSVLGQTRLTISGTGFDIRGRSNQVYIGNSATGAFCDPIPNECTGTRIVCLTGAHDDAGNMPLTVNSFGFNAVCQLRNGCLFTYSIFSTPVVQSIMPQYIIAPGNITVSGYGFSLGDATVGAFDFTLHIGDEERCSLQTTITNTFICLVPSMRPGVLPIDLVLGASGRATIDPSIAYITVLPSISGVSPSSGSTQGGQVITVFGSGFSPDLTDNYVTIHGAACLVVSSTTTYLTCITSSHAPTVSTKPAPIAGACRQDQWLNVPGNQADDLVPLSVYLQPDITTLVPSNALSTYPYCTSCAYRWTTLFLANETGNHTFYFIGDDSVEVWLGNDETPVARQQQAPASGGTRVLDVDLSVYNANRIVKTTQWNVGGTSAPISLVAGRSYWLRILLKQGVGGISLQGTVTTPSGLTKSVENYFSYVPDWVPPVTVEVSDTLAVFTPSCFPRNSCNFDFTQLSTPTITAVHPAVIVPLQTLTITGTGFDTSTRPPAAAACAVNQCGGGGCSCDQPSCIANDPICSWDSSSQTCGFAGPPPQCFQWSLNSVTIDDQPCNVTKQTATRIECTAPFVRLGLHEVSVLVAGSGSADGIFFVQAQPTVFGIAPAQGAVNGGNVITVAGAGFNPEQGGVTVLVGGQECIIASVLTYAVTCIVPAQNPNANSSTAVVEVQTANSRLYVTNFAYQYDAKPARPGTTTVVTTLTMSPASGPMNGGTPITIVLPSAVTLSVASYPAVNVGGQPCTITFALGRRISCLTAPSGQAGTFPSSLSYVDKYGQGQTFPLAPFSFIRTVTYVTTNFASPIGGTKLTIYTDQSYVPSSVSVSIAGQPCRSLDIRGGYIGCVAPPQPLQLPPRPQLASYTFLGDGNMFTNPLAFVSASPGVTVDSSGIAFIPAGGFLMSKASYARPYAVTAMIKPTATAVQGDYADRSVRIRACAGANKLSGVWGSVGGPNGVFYAGNSGWYANANLNQFTSTGLSGAGLDTTSFQKHKLEVMNEFIRYYVNDVLIYTRADTSVMAGTCGVGNSGQDIYLQSFEVESLVNEVLTVNVSGVTLNNQQDILYTSDPTQLQLPIATSMVIDNKNVLQIKGSSFDASASVVAVDPVTGLIPANPVVLCASLNSRLNILTNLLAYSCIPNVRAGTYEAVLLNSAGASASSPISVTTSLTVTSVTPSSGLSSIGQRVTLAGTGFWSGLNVTAGSAACFCPEINSTMMICDVPANAGTSITVSDNDAEASVDVSYGSTSAPTISSVVPATGVWYYTTITVTGTGFTSDAVGSIGYIPCLRSTVISNTTFKCVVGYLSSLYGNQKLRVVQSGGTASFTVPLAPYFNTGNNALTVESTGTGLLSLSGQGFTAVDFSSRTQLVSTFTNITDTDGWSGSVINPQVSLMCTFPLLGPLGGYGFHVAKTFTGLASHNYILVRVRGLVPYSWDQMRVVVDGQYLGILEVIGASMLQCNGVTMYNAEGVFAIQHTTSSAKVLITSPDWNNAYLSTVTIDLADKSPYSVTIGGLPAAVKRITSSRMDVTVPPIATPGNAIILVTLGGQPVQGCGTSSCSVTITNETVNVTAATIIPSVVPPEQTWSAPWFANNQPGAVTVKVADDKSSATLNFSASARLFDVRSYDSSQGVISMSASSPSTGNNMNYYIGLRDRGGLFYGIYITNPTACCYHSDNQVYCVSIAAGGSTSFTFDPVAMSLSCALNNLAYNAMPAPAFTFPATIEVLGQLGLVQVQLSAAISSWDRLLIVGSGFNNADPWLSYNMGARFPSVSLNGTTYYGYESKQRLSVFVPPGSFAVGSSVAYAITTQRAQATGTATLVPTVTQISSNLGGANGGLPLTIIGSPFDGDLLVSVAGDIAQCSPLAPSASQLICTTAAATAGTSGAVTVSVNGASSVFINSTNPFDLNGVSTDASAITFTYDDSKTLSLTSAMLESDELTLIGTNLAGASAWVRNDESLIPHACEVKSSNATVLICTPPSLPVGTFSVRVSNDFGTSSEVPLVVSLAITGFLPQIVGDSGMSTLAITGRGFGSDGDSAVVHVSVANFTLCSSMIRMNTLLLCQTNPGEVSGEIIVTVNNISQTSEGTFTATSLVEVPQVSSASPAQGFGGTVLTVTGTKFDGCNVYVGTTTCAILTRNSTRITCTIDESLPAAKHRVLVVNNVDGASRENISFVGLLVVTSVFPAQGQKEGGQPVTITGRGFSPAMSITMGGAPCSFSTSTASYVVCWTSAMQDASATDVSILIPGEDVEVALAPLVYNYSSSLTASVSLVSPSSGSAGGLETITITGSGFGYDSSAITVLLGMAPCRPDSVADTILTCKTTPTTQAMNVPVRVMLAGEGFATSAATFSFLLEVNSVEHTGDGFSVEGGGVLVLRGNGFWPIDSTSDWAYQYTSVLLNGWLSCPVLDSNRTFLRCMLPQSPRPFDQHAAMSSSYIMPPEQVMSVTVIANGIAATTDPSVLVSYTLSSTPIVSTVAPSLAGSIVTSGVVFTITGTMFAASGNLVTLNGAACQVSSESSNQIICSVTSGNYGRGALQVLVPNIGFASIGLQCPDGSYLTCLGQCVTDPQCQYDSWGVSICAELAHLVNGDTFCNANGGSDSTDLPLLTDAQVNFDLNCPMYSCEGHDCNSSLSIGGHGAVISTCGSDPNAYAFDYRAVVTAVSENRVSSLQGGLVLNITGSDFPASITNVMVLVGSVLCAPTSVSTTNIICQTGSSAAASGLTLTVLTSTPNMSPVPAVCSDPSACSGFSYDSAATPSISSAQFNQDGTVTISGSFLASSQAGLNVIVDKYPCAVTQASSSAITCIISPLVSAGTALLSVQTAEYGLSSGVTQVRVRVSVIYFGPVNGSIGGGTVVTITGFGFSPSAVVTFGGNAATSTQFVDGALIVTTPSFSAKGDVQLQVAVGSSTSNGPVRFGAKTALTPLYSGSIANSNFTAVFSFLPPTVTESDFTVTIGPTPCTITSFSGNQLSCNVDSAVPGGSYTVLVAAWPLGTAVASAAVTYAAVPMLQSFHPSSGSAGGNQTVTLHGQRFSSNPSSVTVTFGSANAVVLSSAPTQIVCLTPPSSQLTDMSVGITVFIQEPTSSTQPLTTHSNQYTYMASKTPVVSSVTPARGSTAGGTRLTIQGQNLDSTQTVTIDGITCTQSFSEQANTAKSGGSTLYCTTGAYVPMYHPSLISVVTVSDGAAVNPSATYQYIDLWSRWTTWGDAPPPQAGDSAVIGEGLVVMIDYSPPKFYLIIVMGTLLFDPTADIFLECTYIMINYGKLIIGTPEEPYLMKATIRLWGTRLTPEIPVHGSKVIALRYGGIEMHGAPRQPTWTHLAATAGAGSANITVRGPVDWKSGEFIAIAPTDFGVREGETRMIVGVVPSDGNADVVMLQLEIALDYTHFGERQCFGPDGTLCVDEIAEVMLLTRNIVVEGDPNSQNYGFGGTMFLMPLGATSDMFCRLSYIELRDVGQQYIVGRYPVHFHVTGTINNSYVHGLSVHDAMNRAFSIHGISNNTYTDNVGYNIEGHAFFIEDGSERFNTIDRNCIIRVKASTSNLNTDITPAAFWIVNPLNYVTRNAGSGSDAYGLWISPFAPFSTGPTASTNVCPWLEQLGAFDDNVGHSNLWHGIHIFQHWRPKSVPCNPNSADAQAVLHNNVVYKNNIWGLAMGDLEVGSIGAVVLNNLTSADNGFVNKDGASFWIEIVAAANQTCGLQNSLLIAHTANNPYHRAEHRRGVNLAKGDNFFTENVTFVNFNGENFGFEPQAWANRMSFCFPWGWEAVSRGLKWINSPNRILFRFVHHGVLNDDDGTLGGLARSQVVPDTPILRDPSCHRLNSSINSNIPSLVCPSSFKIRRFGIDTSTPPRLNQVWTVDGRTEIVPVIDNGYLVTAPVSHTMNVSFLTPYTPNFGQHFGGLTFVQPSERIGFAVQYLNFPDHVYTTFDGSTNTNYDVPLPSVDVNTTSCYGFNQTEAVLSLVLSRPSTAFWATAYPCPVSGCSVPVTSKPWERRCYSYADPALWSGTTPDLKTDAVIPETVHVCLGYNATASPFGHSQATSRRSTSGPRQCTATSQVVTYNLGTLTLNGAVTMTNEQCPCVGGSVIINIARYMYVRGGGFILGNATNPITDCTVTINIGEAPFDQLDQLHPYLLSFYGYRALVLEFGLLELFGAAPQPLWTNLRATAAAGATTLALATSVTWKAGQVIGIAGTNRDGRYQMGLSRVEQSETATIASVSSDGLTVTLTDSLKFSHYGAAPATINAMSYETGAEVAVLSRTISITGNTTAGSLPALNAGWKLVIGCTAENTPGCSSANAMSTTNPGTVHVDSVLFLDAGQASLDVGAVTFDGLTNGTDATGSYFSRNAFLRSYNSPFFVRDTTTGIEIRDNVIFDFWDDGVRVASAGNVISGNLAIAMAAIDPMCPNIPNKIGWNCRTAMFRIHAGNSVRGNVAASGMNFGFLTEGDACDGSWDWSNNVAHSVKDGLFVTDGPATPEWGWTTYSSPSTCRVVGGVLSYWCADHGLIGWYVRGNVSVVDYMSVDNAVGSAMMSLHAGQFQTYVPTVKYTNVTYAGFWTTNWPCRQGVSAVSCRSPMIQQVNWCKMLKSTSEDVGNVGAVETIFVSDMISGPTIGEELFLWEEADSYSTVNGQVFFKGAHFANWNGKDSCKQHNVAFFPSIYSNDTFHAHYFSAVTWENTGDSGKLWTWRAYGAVPLFPTDDVTPTYYLDFNNYILGAFWPDSLNKALIIDLDGSFTGAGAKTSLVASETLTRTTPFSSIRWDGRGFAAGSLSPARPGCTWKAAQNAFQCDSTYQWLALNIESMSSDSLTRRAGPLVLCKGDGMIQPNGDPLCQGNAGIDFASGPIMKGKTQRATLDRLSRWRFWQENAGNYTLAFRSTPPSHLRLSLSDHEYLGASSNIGTIINLRYFGENADSRVGVYVNGKKQLPVFGFGYPYQMKPPTSWPGPTDAPGTHFMNIYKDSRMNADGSQGYTVNVLSLTMRPGVIIDLVQEPIVQVTMQVSLTIDQFFQLKDTFVAAMASVLGIPAANIHFAKIVAGTNRRSSGVSITWQIDQTSSSATLDSTGQVSSSGSLNLTSVVGGLNSIAQNTTILAAAVQRVSGGTATVTIAGVVATTITVVPTRPTIAVPFGTPFVSVNVTKSTGTFSAAGVAQLIGTWVQSSSGLIGAPFNTTVADNTTIISNVFTDSAMQTQFAVAFGYDNTTLAFNALKALSTALQVGSGSAVLTGYTVLNVALSANGFVAQQQSSSVTSPSKSDNTIPFIIGICVGVGGVLIIGGGLLFYFFNVRAREAVSIEVENSDDPQKK